MSNTLAYASLGQRKKKRTVKKKKPRVRSMKELSKAVLGRKRGGKA